MAWSPKRAMVEQAAKLAKEKHPDGFTIGQLRDAGKEVFGGFGNDFSRDESSPLHGSIHRPIKTMEDVGNVANAMALIDGRYPVGMSGCETVGINGGCGLECPVFLAGDCEEHAEVSQDAAGGCPCDSCVTA